MRHLRFVLSVLVLLVAASAVTAASSRGSFKAGNARALRSAKAHASAGSACSEAEAHAVARQHKLGDSSLDYPVAQVLCGPFAGPDSNVMAFSLHYYGCIAVSGFVVARFTGGDWQLLVAQKFVPFISLSVAGTDIREKVSVLRAGDGRCVPSGGERTRLWHWNGSKLVAGAWKQTSPAKQPDFGGFRTPSGNIFCNNAYGEHANHRVYFLQCGIKSGLKPPPPRKGPHCTRALWVSMVGSGHAAWSGSTCPGHDEAQGPIFELAKQMLRYGQHWSWRGMSCSSAFKGLTCHNTSGHGFFVSRANTHLF